LFEDADNVRERDLRLLTRRRQKQDNRPAARREARTNRGSKPRRPRQARA
jgi:hypothetical protein